MRELIDAEATIKMHAAALIAIETAIERQQFAVCPLLFFSQLNLIILTRPSRSLDFSHSFDSVPWTFSQSHIIRLHELFTLRVGKPSPRVRRTGEEEHERV